jgi:hypothetical protein
MNRYEPFGSSKLIETLLEVCEVPFSVTDQLVPAGNPISVKVTAYSPAAEGDAVDGAAREPTALPVAAIDEIGKNATSRAMPTATTLHKTVRPILPGRPTDSMVRVLPETSFLILAHVRNLNARVEGPSARLLSTGASGSEGTQGSDPRFPNRPSVSDEDLADHQTGPRS